MVTSLSELGFQLTVSFEGMTLVESDLFCEIAVMDTAMNKKDI
jgi:hypothetical protein